MAVMAEQRDPIELAEAVAYGRIAFGLALMAVPSLTSMGYLGREASRPSVRFLNRLFGGRDVALGLWAVLSREDKAAFRQAVAVGAACDAWDAVATAITPGGVPRFGKPMMIAVAAGAAAVGAMAVRQLEV
mgnify:CR=1 FL=1